MIKCILGAYCADMHKVFIFTNKNEMNPFREDLGEPKKKPSNLYSENPTDLPSENPKTPGKTPFEEHQRNRTHKLNL